MNKDGRDFYQQLNQEVIEALKENRAPWEQSADGYHLPELPMNPVTGKSYNAANMLHLLLAQKNRGAEMNHYDSAKLLFDPRFLTPEQGKEMGALIRPGARGERIINWRHTKLRPMLDADNHAPVVDDDGHPLYEVVELEKPEPVLATVFHASDFEGMPQFFPYDGPHRASDNATAYLQKLVQACDANIQYDGAFDRPPRYDAEQDVIHTSPAVGNSADSVIIPALCRWAASDKRLNLGVDATPGSADAARGDLRVNLAAFILTSKHPGNFRPEPSSEQAREQLIAILEKDPLEIHRAVRDANQIVEYLETLELEKREAPMPLVCEENVYLPRLRDGQVEPFFNMGGRYNRERGEWHIPAGTELRPFISFMPDNNERMNFILGLHFKKQARDANHDLYEIVSRHGGCCGVKCRDRDGNKITLEGDEDFTHPFQAIQLVMNNAQFDNSAKDALPLPAQFACELTHYGMGADAEGRFFSIEKTNDLAEQTAGYTVAFLNRDGDYEVLYGEHPIFADPETGEPGKPWTWLDAFNFALEEATLVVTQELEKRELPPIIAQEDTRLYVPYSQTPLAQEMGAKFRHIDGEGHWYAPVGTNLANVAAWLPPEPERHASPPVRPEDERLSPTAEFEDRLQRAGLVVSSAEIDGQVHETPVAGDRPNAQKGRYQAQARMYVWTAKADAEAQERGSDERPAGTQALSGMQPLKDDRGGLARALEKDGLVASVPKDASPDLIRIASRISNEATGLDEKYITSGHVLAKSARIERAKQFQQQLDKLRKQENTQVQTQEQTQDAVKPVDKDFSR